MTLRQRISGCVLAGALACGGVVALPVMAASVAAQPAKVHAGDPLSGYARTALVTLQSFQDTGNRRTNTSFVTERDAIAVVIAERLGIDPARMQAAWRAADLDHQVALLAALSQLGVPYHRNSSKPGVAFDCSGLTTWAWAQAGVTLTRQSRSQINQSRKVTLETAQAGDLVYYPGHVMMYLGVDAAIVHAPYTGKTVEVTQLTKRHLHTIRVGDPTG